VVHKGKNKVVEEGYRPAEDGKFRITYGE